MLVKHNLYEKPVLQIPSMPVQGYGEIINNSLTIKDMSGPSYNYLQEAYSLTIGNHYYVGFIGDLIGKARLYKGEYKNVVSIGDIHYIEHTHNENSKMLHIYGYNTDMTIKQIFITDEIPDLVIPNKKDFSEDIQAYYLSLIHI